MSRRQSTSYARAQKPSILNRGELSTPNSEVWQLEATDKLDLYHKSLLSGERQQESST
jgi:hypothetical protein